MQVPGMLTFSLWKFIIVYCDQSRLRTACLNHFFYVEQCNLSHGGGNVLQKRHYFCHLLACQALENHVYSLRCRNHFVYAPSKWETTSQCKVISHWLGAYTKWSLVLWKTTLRDHLDRIKWLLYTGFTQFRNVSSLLWYVINSPAGSCSVVSLEVWCVLSMIYLHSKISELWPGNVKIFVWNQLWSTFFFKISFLKYQTVATSIC